MNSTLCRTLRKMLSDGFEQYNGVIDPAVYERLECTKPERAYWICNWPILHCLGCNNRCTPKTPEGFQIMLPMNAAQEEIERQAQIAALLQKNFLRPDEAALCLDVSERQVRKWADEGVLIRHKRRPVRITAESVRVEMDKLDI